MNWVLSWTVARAPAATGGDILGKISPIVISGQHIGGKRRKRAEQRVVIAVEELAGHGRYWRGQGWLANPSRNRRHARGAWQDAYV